MPLTVGTQLGSHEITSLLGKGGMGEVDRARDLKLKREVAIKILPDEFASDSDRVIRFQREAEVLASLVHPNIAGIYDIQESKGTRFLILELVEGETLADHIAHGPIPVDEALAIAVQICEALEAADGSGVAERLSTAEKNTYHSPLGWTSDGKTLAFYVASPTGGGSVWTLSLDGDRKPKPLVVSSAVSGNIRRISFSPNGEWIAYSSNEEASFSVYVQPYPPTGAKYKISTKGGGDSPVWSHDGKQLVFSSGGGLKFVDVQTKPGFSSSEPKPLPVTIENTQGRPYDISQDGKTFLVMQRPAETASSEKSAPQVNVVLNWFRELQERVPVK